MTHEEEGMCSCRFRRFGDRVVLLYL